MTSSLHANVERFTGFADTYDKYRPQPPMVLIDILTQLAQTACPRLVVDLGCGTGLSTRIWAGRASAVIGVEPSDDMRRIAEAQAAAIPDTKHIRYKAGYAHDTGLADACADIVTCAQSLHWMEPAPTFAEVARILRAGGVFAAYDYNLPPTLNWQAEDACHRFEERAQKIGAARVRDDRGIKKLAKADHLARMQASDMFRSVKEIVAHHTEPGNAERLIGLALSQGSIQDLLKRGLSEDEIGVPALRVAAQQALGDQAFTWYFSYRVRIGIK